MIKSFLLAPGPTPVPPEVLAAMALPIIHHRTPQFGAVLAEVQTGLRELFGNTASIRSLERRIVTEYFLSAEHAVEVFRTYFGPTNRAFAMLDAAGQRELAADIAALFLRDNRATDGTLAVPLEYLQALLTVA